MKFSYQRQKPISACGLPWQTGKEGLGRTQKLTCCRRTATDVKKSIKAMCPNKTDSAIEGSSKSCGGEKHTVESFDCQVNRDHHSPSHSNRSSDTDEGKVLTDLRELIKTI